ncbi:hypothetical protein WQ54_18695 [Bacillus sp. SA1-12]|uniref:hypothetical protein n=1 Tax=Bacillus sp. SA1-12 TaxID=1455638 RepID=UPI000626F77D|nr:hypothetical protein [Bacillus sp. SA1-12]KKI90779.1 hypothetical protein WQ54_18695 [Bacillus sp. SA1-12]
MKKFAPIFIIVATIAIIGYFDSASFAEKEEAITSTPLPVEETASAAASNEDSDKQSPKIPTLETRLVDRTEEDGYIIEVYREYEIYKDEKGNIIDTVATDNYQYLRYKE